MLVKKLEDFSTKFAKLGTGLFLRWRYNPTISTFFSLSPRCFYCVGGENTEGGNGPKVVSGFSRAEKKVVEGKSLVAFLLRWHSRTSQRRDHC
jgi:hypothetical protein